MKLHFHPYTRIVFFLLGITGAFLCKNNFILLTFWLILLVPTTIITNSFKAHLKLLTIVAVPMLSMLIFLEIAVKGNYNLQSTYSLVLKLISYTTIFQLCLNIPPKHLFTTFRMWGLKGETLIIFLGSYTVFVDVKKRANKILTARFSRGFIKKRTILNKFKQVPHLLVPLIIGILRTATERSESWEEKDMLGCLENLKVKPFEFNLLFNLMYSILVISWFFVNLIIWL